MDGKRLLPLISLAGALIAHPVFALDCCIVLNDRANVTSASKPEDVKECRPMTFGDCTTYRQNNTTLKTEYRAKECSALSFCGEKQPDGCCKVTRDGKPISCTPSPDSVACDSFVNTFRSEVQKEGGDRYDYSANYVGGKTCSDDAACAGVADDPRTGAKAPPPTAEAAPEIRNVTPAIPVLGVPIPGLPSFEAPGGSYGAGYAIPWIAQYVSALYAWVLATVITLAIAMTVWGGAKWLTAGGDTSRVSSAKTTIVNATTGLMLALGTYLLLWTLNPAILEFKALQIATVENIPIAEEYSVDTEDAAPGAPAPSGPIDQSSFVPVKEPCIEITPPGANRDLTEALKRAGQIFCEKRGTNTKWTITGSSARDVNLGVKFFVQRCLYREKCTVPTGSMGLYEAGALMRDPAGLLVPKDPRLQSYTAKQIADDPGALTTVVDALKPLADLSKSAHGRGVAVDIYCKHTKGVAIVDFACQKLLEEAMRDAGFCRLRHEYWHFEHIPNKYTVRSCLDTWTIGQYQPNATDKNPDLKVIDYGACPSGWYADGAKKCYDKPRG